jgi:hypothetical protein
VTKNKIKKVTNNAQYLKGFHIFFRRLAEKKIAKQCQKEWRKSEKEHCGCENSKK